MAYLQHIWWLEAIGELDQFEFPPGSYTLCFRLQLGKPTIAKRFGRRLCVDDQVHGWDPKPVQFHLATSNGHRASSECFLQQPAGTWCYCQVGDFVVEKPNMPIDLKFSMVQIDCTHTKGGLCLDSVLIYPTEFRDRLKP